MALMKLSYHYKMAGHEVFFESSVSRSIFEPQYDLVLASAIFSESEKKINKFKSEFPNAIIGGTWLPKEQHLTVEDFLKVPETFTKLDYSIYPEFKFSIGMTQIGCHKKCGFCVVPWKEGKNRPVANIKEIHRAYMPKKLILIDNDFQSRNGWQQICEEIIDGGFEVAFIQGINMRALTDEHIDYFKQIKFRNRKFTNKRFYCAWDNEKDRAKIVNGIAILNKAGMKPYEISPYMLANYYHKGLSEDLWLRFLTMAELGLRPYCMIYEKWTLPPNDDLKIFQNWVNTMNCYNSPTKIGFSEYKNWYLNRSVKQKTESIELF